MLVIVTDLDATLLDAESYSFEPALPALRAARGAGVPIILATSKTKAEVQPLRERLGLSDPYIVENGSAIYFPGRPPGGQEVVKRFAAPYEETLRVLGAASQACGIRTRGFHEMPAEEVAERTGLSVAEAVRARTREHSEPFVLLDDVDPGPLIEAIERLGKRYTRGGRFHHIGDRVDKGSAVRYLRAEFQKTAPEVRMAGLGDALNDVEMLAACDVAFIVASSNAGALLARIPHATVTSKPGPAGWNEAVLGLLKGCGGLL